MLVSKEIISWYEKNKRDLPWRQTKNPYIIWISEILLQQTRVNQAIGYFNRFTTQFPDIKTLANAEEKLVLKYWQGLGYYSRARNLHYSAKYIMKECSGIFPNSYDKIIKLKGVGEYTAAAIASFAFGERVPAIDGNVYRVLARLFNEQLAINSANGKKVFKLIAEELIKNQRADQFNQAMIEFGALLCKPANPLCIQCPIVEMCLAHKNKTIANLPVKNKLQKVKKRYFSYLYIRSGDKILIKERTEKDIWKGLYEFPLIETTQETETKELILTKNWLDTVGEKFKLLKILEPKTHRLSHQLLNVTFYIIEVDRFKAESHYKKINLGNLNEYPVPKVIENLINELDD
ncbi:MAG: A/G-specific adenine glycosylase [Bacteroidetes bacterium]|nr:MAG: A/G-specific adenine glycosylase [Bacteroidota bacterium]